MKKLFLLTTLVLFSVKVFSQVTTTTGITIKDEFYNNRPLVEILSDLESKVGARFVFDPAKTKGVYASFWFDNMSLETGMRGLLKGSGLKFYVDDNQIVHIIPKAQKVYVKSSYNSGTYYGGNSSVAAPPIADVGINSLTVPSGTNGQIAVNRPSIADVPTTNVRRQVAKAAVKHNFTFTGRIIDTRSAEPLPFVNILVKSNRTGTQTNVDGYFTLLKVPSDTTTLVLSYIGYVTTTIKLVPDAPISGITIEMEPDNTELDEVVVKGEKTEVLKAAETIGMFKMTPRNIAKLPNVGEKDIFRAFQLMPGISAANQSSSGLYVRGGTPDQNLVLYDGFTVYYVDHLYGFFSAFNSNPIKDVQLYKGGFDAKFGGRISSVVEITSKDGNKREVNFGGDLSLISANVWAEGPVTKNKKVTFSVAGRRSWAGPLYNKIFNTFNTTTTGQNGINRGFRQSQSAQTATSYFYDLNGKVTFKPSENENLTLSIYNGDDYLDNSQSINLPFGGGGGLSNTDLSKWGNTGSSLKWSKKWSDKFYTNTLISYSNFFSNRDNTSNGSFVRNNETTTIKFGSIESNDLKDFSAKTDIEYNTSKINQIAFGIQATRLNIQYSNSQNDTTVIIAKNDKGSLLTAYLQDQLKLFDNKLVLKGGVRANYFDVTSKYYFEPRLSGTFAVNDRLKFKGAWGIYYQFAKQVEREDISNGSRNFWVLANNNYLPVTSSTHYIFGLSYELNDYLFDVEGYYKDIQNDTRYTLRFAPQIGRGLIANETFFNGTGKVKGIDFLIQRKFGDYTGWIGYTFAHSDKYIAQFSADKFPSNFDVRHEFKSVNIYKLGRWDLGATWIYASGKPYTSIVGGYTVKLLDGTEKDFTDPSTTNGNRLPASHRLDVSATYNFSHGSIGLSVFNLYGRTNVWYKKYQTVTDATTGDKYLSITDVNYLGFTPNITFSYKFK
jgi:ferric enterobactin receptor